MSIRVSEKHGVNPSMGVCFFCGEDDGTIILPGRLEGDKEAPRRAVWSHEPCPTCKDYMKQGVILISVRADPDADVTNPYRTGGFVVMKDEAIERMFDPKTAPAVLKKRVAFVDDETWDMIGLPRVEKARVNTTQEVGRTP